MRIVFIRLLTIDLFHGFINIKQLKLIFIWITVFINMNANSF